jgi:DNA-binding response OmpR family regulator
MEKKKALIIDKEPDFCLLMAHYLSGKNIDTYYTDTIDEGLEIIEIKRPDLIIADKNLLGLENSLHFIINATNDYDPTVFLHGIKSPRKEESRMDLIDEITKWINDKF